MVNGHKSLSINGGNNLKFASNLLMSLSGTGHSITPCMGVEKKNKTTTEMEEGEPTELSAEKLALILCKSSRSIPMQAEGMTLVFRSVSPSRAAVCKRLYY